MPWRVCRVLCRVGTGRQLCLASFSRNTRGRPFLFAGQHHNTYATSHTEISKHDELVQSPKRDPDSNEDDTVSVAGLVRSIRKQKKVAFAHVSDGTTLESIQAILDPDQAQEITNGSYVQLRGEWKRSLGQGQDHELQVKSIEDLGTTNSDEFPIQKKTQTPDFLRNLPHLRFRTPLYSLLARARSQLTADIQDYYNNHRPFGAAVQVHPPLITSSDCEGAGEVFTISPKSSVSPKNSDTKEELHLYFKDPKYLTVSSQLHLEAYSAELGDVWTLSPTFRAEESETPRHLSEFYMLEAEHRSVTSLTDLMVEVELLIKDVVESFSRSRVGIEILSYHSNSKHQAQSTTTSEPLNIELRWEKVLTDDWPNITYAEAIKHLETYHASNPNVFTHAPSYTTGLQLEHERHLVQHLANNTPLFITDYPKQIKPFYMLPSSQSSDAAARNIPANSSNDTVACFDLLFPFGTAELIGGSLREHRLPNLIQNMREKNLLKHVSDTSASTPLYPHLEPGESLGTMQWYADLRRYGSAPHGGFGMGFDRLLAYLTGVASVKDTVGFPRWFGRADC